MQHETVIWDKRPDGIAILTLDRPEAGNSINQRMDEEVAGIWAEVKADPAVKVVIITGSGGRFFCTGADMKEWAQTGQVPMARLPGGHGFRLLARDQKVFKPIICAVNGICAGGGLHFVNDGDIVICADHAVFLDPHVSVGQVTAEEPIGLSRRVPLEFVMRMSLLGVHAQVSAERAWQVGLVGELVPAGRLLDRALELAGLVARNSLAAMMKSKQALIESLDCGLRPALDNGFALLSSHWSHPDCVEGPRAFAGKRSPHWSS